MTRRTRLTLGLIAATLAALTSDACIRGEQSQTAAPSAGASNEPVRSADWLNALPEGDTRRQVVLGCTPCHQLGPPLAFKKTLDEWKAVVTRMKQIDDDLDLALIPLNADELANWLYANARMPAEGHAVKLATAEVREYPVGAVTGFYHDMTVTPGRAWRGSPTTSATSSTRSTSTRDASSPGRSR
jgi:hypothetical protein